MGGRSVHMLGNASVVVIVPARNEAPRIGDVIAQMPDFVDRIIVVDDASSDGTHQAAIEVRDPRTVVLRHDDNQGVGAAIVTGYRRAMAGAGHDNDVFVVMAGDGQMDPADLPVVCGPIVRGEAGYVKGNRFDFDGAWRIMPIERRVAGEFLSFVTSLATGTRIRDSQCGFTAISRAACARIDLTRMWPRYGYPNDLIARLALEGIPIREVIVRPIYRGEPSGVRARHVLRILWLLARSSARRQVR